MKERGQPPPMTETRKPMSLKDQLLFTAKTTVALGALVALSSPLALTSDQRRSVREERDCGKCQFPHPVGDMCKGQLEVHHIRPQRWAKEHGISEDENDQPENVLTICKRSHSVHVHPDMETARQSYYQDRGSYNLAFRNRDELVREGKVYWNTAYDKEMKIIAQERTIHAMKEGWEYPVKPPKKVRGPKK